MKGVTPDVLSRANSVRKEKGRKKGEVAAQDLAFAFTFLFVFSPPLLLLVASLVFSLFFPFFLLFSPLLFFFWLVVVSRKLMGAERQRRMTEST